MPLLPKQFYMFLKSDAFVEGMLSANPELKPPPLFHLDFLRLCDISRKALTDMLHGKWEVKSKYHRVIHNFFMLTVDNQRELLDELGVYVFPTPSQIGSPDEEASDNDVDNEDLEEDDNNGATFHALSIRKI